MATTHSTTQTAADTLLDAADLLSEARALAAFVQSMALNSGPEGSIVLTPDQLCGMSYSMQDIIDRIKRAESAILARGYLMDGTTTGKTMQAGAMAAHAALRNIEKVAERQRRPDGETLSMDEWWALETGAVKALQSAAGQQNDFMAGFLATLAEYTLGAMSVAGNLNLDKWKPEAAMTETEKMAARAKFGKEVNELLSETA